DERAAAIEQACAEIADGALHEDFVVDVIQGGAGTSTNMNANEVIANRALEILGRSKASTSTSTPTTTSAWPSPPTTCTPRRCGSGSCSPSRPWWSRWTT